MTLAVDHTGSYHHPEDPGEPTTGKPRLSVTDEEAEILAYYSIGATVLEIGTGLGVSTRALASTAVWVTTVDVDPWVHKTIWPTLPANVRGAKQVPDGVFDLAFIDGDHHTRSVIRDVTAAFAVVRPGGVILAHDFNYESVRQGLGPGWGHHDTTHGIGFLTV